MCKESLPGGAPVSTVGRADLASVQEPEGSEESEQAFLREVSHDFGNHFHRIYYVADQLRRGLEAAEQPELVAAAVELEEVAAEVEGLLRSTLRYLAPVESHMSEVEVSDVVASIRQRLDGRRPLEVTGVDEYGGWRMAVDLSLLAEVLTTVCVRVMESLEAGETLRAAVLPAAALDSGVTFAFEGGSGSATAATSPVSMALAAKYVRLHGGRLSETGDGGLELELPAHC